MENNRPDIKIYKEKKSCLLIDPSCRFDPRIANNEGEKLKTHNVINFEIANICYMNLVKVLSIITGALGNVSNDIDKLVE